MTEIAALVILALMLTRIIPIEVDPKWLWSLVALTLLRITIELSEER